MLLLSHFYTLYFRITCYIFDNAVVKMLSKGC
nr:MAG TPA: hypothetical protein [Caudoviricetes sp.]